MTINEDLHPNYVMDIRRQSRTDMSTGLVSVDRGFDFATEEHGVAMQRIQTNLSERRSSRMPVPPDPDEYPDLPSPKSPTGSSRKGKERHMLDSLRRGIMKKKTPTTGKRPSTSD